MVPYHLIIVPSRGQYGIKRSPCLDFQARVDGPLNGVFGDGLVSFGMMGLGWVGI